MTSLTGAATAAPNPTGLSRRLVKRKLVPVPIVGCDGLHVPTRFRKYRKRQLPDSAVRKQESAPRGYATAAQIRKRLESGLPARRRPDACWEWQGRVNDRGYGTISLGGYPGNVHRVMYELTYGFLLSRLFYVCHRCGNPSCCNPGHMYVGTPQDNAMDHFLDRYPDHPNARE